MTKTEISSEMNDQARLRALLDTAVDGIITIDERGIIEAANPASEQLFGYGVAEMVGRNVSMLMPSPFAEEHDGYLNHYAMTGERKIIGIGREVKGQRKDGTVFPLYLAVSEVTFGHRRVFTGFVHDLTALREAEQQATQLGRILESSMNEIFVFDAKTLKFLLVNRGALENIDYTATQMSKMTPLDINPEFETESFRKRLAPLLAGTETRVQFETLHQRRNESRYNVHVRLQKTNWQGREAFVAVVMDITEQKRVQEALVTRDAQLEFMVEHLPAAAAYVDFVTGAVRFNPGVRQITGYAAQELTTLEICFERLFGPQAEEYRRLYDHNHANWRDKMLRLTIRRKDSVARVVEFRGYRYNDHEVWLLQDVTEQDRHDTELRIRDQAIQAANEGIVITDATRANYPIIFVNQGFESLSGFTAEESVGRGCDLLCGNNPDAECHRLLQSAIAGQKEFRTTLRCFRKDGQPFWNEVSIAPVRSAQGRVTHMVAIMEDVSERRQTQQQMLQSERLAAIGQMVTGLAHESRNALQRAQACMDMLSLDLEDQPEQLELTEKTRVALSDLYRYYEEVRNYAAPINLDRRPTDLARLWRETWRNLEPLRADRDMKLIEPDTDTDLTSAIDAHRIEQVFRNIMENSISACGDSGCLTIGCSVVTEAGKESVRLSFRDNGPGFSVESAANVFQPFFTTKHKGTGLGMAITRRIVEAHGGQIEISDASLPGAEVVVILPKRAVG